MSGREWAVTWVQRYLSLEHRESLDVFLEQMWAPNAVMVHGGRIVRGRVELRAFYGQIFAQTIDATVELGRVVGDDQELAFEWSSVARMIDGSRLAAAGCDMVTLEQGKIATGTTYLRTWDPDPSA